MCAKEYSTLTWEIQEACVAGKKAGVVCCLFAVSGLSERDRDII